jgi:hypothetical protein
MNAAATEPNPTISDAIGKRGTSAPVATLVTTTGGGVGVLWCTGGIGVVVVVGS